MDDATRAGLDAALDRRFGDAGGLAAAAPDAGLDGLAALARHRVIRGYAPREVPDALLRLVCAAALSSPTKSDLQQRDLVLVTDPA
ncbi:MAG: NADPH-dependent oxidoreductase, partial [Alphaproteobacteria bacterium]